jgi:UDPglucose--hexose-1-phosphate uridylyltransferase
VAYNFVIYTAPSFNSFNELGRRYPELPSYFRWHVELFPRITRLGGFELGSGTLINVVPPEQAALELRNAVVSPA